MSQRIKTQSQVSNNSHKSKDKIIPTIAGAYIIYLSFGITFIIIAVLLFIQYNTIIQVEYTHYNQNKQCQKYLHTTTPCIINISITQKMSQPVYFMFQLQNYYQNNRRYLQNKNNKQLAGFQVQLAQIINDCTPIVYNSDLSKQYSWTGVKLNPHQVANPCGLIAKYVFNDTYKLKDPNGNRIYINEDIIIHPSDKGKKYKRSVNSQSKQWTDPQDPHFIVWMRTSILPQYQKLWGIINADLQIGNYTIQIINNYDSGYLNAGKNLRLSTIGIFGLKSPYIYLSFLFSGVVCFGIMIIFFFRSKTTNGKFGKLQQEMDSI